MTAAEFVARLRALDVRLSVDGERLRCSAPKGVLSDDLREQLAARKAEVLAWLREHDDGGAAAAEIAGLEHQQPLSFAQQRLWFMDQLQPGGFTYNISGGIRLLGPLRLDALEWGLGELVRRHDGLRAVFTAVGGQPVQVILPAGEVRLPVLDLRETSVGTRRAEGERQMVEEAERAFDLRKGPLFRARLYRFAAEEHILQLTFHHIVADRWSLGVLLKQVAAAYAARAAGAETLGPPSVGRADILGRPRRRLGGPALDAQAAYWRERLSPPPPVLDLPADHPRPPLLTFNGRVESFLIPDGLAEGLRRIAGEHGGTLFMALLAAFDVLLHRYTGACDIAVGTPASNRTDLDDVVGLFANPLVLRTDLTGDPTVRELLRRVRDVVLGAYAATDFPFERLVDTVWTVRDMSHSPLFQVMLVLQGAPFETTELAGLTMTYVDIRTRSAKTDLTLEFRERPDGLQLHVEYNTDLFEVETIRRLVRHLERILSAFVTDPEQRVSRLPILDEEEWRRTMVEWNATDSIIGEEAMTRRFEARAARAPEAIAVRFEERQLSYRDLNERANRLAHRVRRHGVGPDVLVGILVERSLDMLVAVLAVMKAGGAYVPLDPAYPADRLEFMLQDGRISLVITQEGLPDRIAIPDETRTIRVDRDAHLIDQENDENLEPRARLDDLAYVIYTSGSTGRPKGVQISHRSLVNVLTAFRDILGVDARDILVAVTTLSFDIAGLELLLPLLAGGQVVVASREVAADPAKLMGLFSDVGATIVQATPATWRMLLEAGWCSASGLRLLCGGEALSSDLAARLLTTGASVWNVYGPTETTIWSTVHRLDERAGPVPIGRPVTNTRIYVLDAGGQPRPVGVPGELYIGGAGVARGYLNRPELTAEKFVGDPFSPDPSARLYRTGDIARYRADGTLEFLGRVDHQVKVRGFRIELGEIETVLSRHAAVAEAVVVAREDGPGIQHLAAYVRPAGTTTPAAAELRAFLTERLPEYMVPSTFTILPSFPLTPNGKVDRRRLPEPQGRRPSHGRSLAPRSEIERTIAEVWRGVLRLDDVGVDDNFFDLGGHSLLLVQVQARLREALTREVAIVEMFQYPTIRAMATHLGSHKAEAREGER